MNSGCGSGCTVLLGVIAFVSMPADPGRIAALDSGCGADFLVRTTSDCGSCRPSASGNRYQTLP
jgi:hypothetical protein